MNAVSIDIKDMLIGAGLGLSFGTNLFIAKMPTTPVKVVCLYDVASVAPELGITEHQYNRDVFQCVVRDNSYSDAMTKAYQIMEWLQGKRNIQINGMTYTLIRALFVPYLMEWDDNNRPNIIFSMEAQRR